MRFHFHQTMLFLAFLLTGAGLMLAQEQPGIPGQPIHGEAEPAVKAPGSPQQELEQLYHRIAAIYREMAVISQSDPGPIRDLKRQYAQLAEAEDRAASYHAQLDALVRQAAAKPKQVNYGDSAFRR